MGMWIRNLGQRCMIHLYLVFYQIKSSLVRIISELGIEKLLGMSRFHLLKN